MKSTLKQIKKDIHTEKMKGSLEKIQAAGKQFHSHFLMITYYCFVHQFCMRMQINFLILFLLLSSLSSMLVIFFLPSFFAVLRVTCVGHSSESQARAVPVITRTAG